MKKLKLSIYVKFALVILVGSIVPIAILSTVILNVMFDAYRDNLKESYRQGVIYSTYAMQALLESYNDSSKFQYYYNLSSETQTVINYENYDTLRKILTGEAFENEENKQRRIAEEMDVFFSNLLRTNSDIAALHFLYEDEQANQTFFHAASDGSSFANEEIFLNTVDINAIDKNSNQLMIIPVHDFAYIGYQVSSKEKVFTIARNYFDATDGINNFKYVGTLFIDFKLNSLQEVFYNIDLSQNSVAYVYDDNNLCIFSTDENVIGTVLTNEQLALSDNSDEEILLLDDVENYNLKIAVKVNSLPISEQVHSMQNTIYVFVVVSIILLLVISFMSSRKLTYPILVLKQKMKQVAEGEFSQEIKIQSNDELGELTANFNQMTVDLQNYTNRVYVAEIQRKEAELSALKSQIYPHFLYNTLEVIRMTALSHKDEMLAKMIEALSDQIRYLIGKVGDVVPMELEIDILQKYIYLINCRFDEKVDFEVDLFGLGKKFIPKLILQPIIENAFEHGIKPKNKGGKISLNVEEVDDVLEITVMDDGCGMNKQRVILMEKLLASENPGLKNEYKWKSIGLKNVHDRLRFLYGERYGVAIYSRENRGTAVKITLPNNVEERELEKNVQDDFSR